MTSAEWPSLTVTSPPPIHPLDHEVTELHMPGGVLPWLEAHGAPPPLPGETIRQYNFRTEQMEMQQLDPTANETVPVNTQVQEYLQRRLQYGIRKYGTPLQAGNGRDALIDRFEELTDVVQYCAQELIERDGKLPDVVMPTWQEATDSGRTAAMERGDFMEYVGFDGDFTNTYPDITDPVIDPEDPHDFHNMRGGRN